MDIMMLRLNGLDATRKIRSLKRSDAQKIPVIAMSANAFADDIINSRISDMNLHLSKPLDEEKIVSAIKECIVSRKIEIPSV
jgi:CheY-like chemotaxis protein